MNYSLVLLGFTSLILLNSGCGIESVSQTELLGQYALSNGHQNDRILLRADGTYIHTVTNSGTLSLVNSNVWRIVQEQRRSLIRLDSFVRARETERVILPYATTGTPSVWFMEVEKRDGKFCFRLSHEEDLYYIRQPDT